MNKLFLIVAITTLLTSCGSVGSKFISDEALKQKAAFALNTAPESVSISNRTTQIDSIHFIAKVGKRSHQCYITTVMGVVSSDALCTNSKGSKSVKSNKQQCNDLLRAANRC